MLFARIVSQVNRTFFSSRKSFIKKNARRPVGDLKGIEWKKNVFLAFIPEITNVQNDIDYILRAIVECSRLHSPKPHDT